MRILLFIPLLALLFGGCESESFVQTSLDVELKQAIHNSSTDGTLEHFVLPDSDDFNSIPQDPHNPLTKEKVNLGQMLFFETGLGLDAVYEEGIQTYSCGSCHIASAGLKPGAMQGIADGGQAFGVNGEGRVKNPLYADSELDVQGIRPLAVLNTAFVPNTQWSGQFGATHVNEGLEHLFGVNTPESIQNHTGFQGLEAQNIEGLRLHRMRIDRTTMTDLGYKEMFDAAFPDFPESERYNDTTGSFALSAFLRVVMSNKAPFQEWLKGNYTAMTEQEKRGAIVFFDKGNCSSCHSEANLGSNRFFALGVNDMDQQISYNRDPNSKKNLGRGGFTGDPEDYYKFKVPQLYNVGDNPFYFHGSSLTTLEEVVDYFDEAVPQNARVPESQIASQFKPLHLTDQEKEDLAEFLRNGLRDPDLERYLPEEIMSGLCFPNNDPRSISETGCN